MRRRRSSERIRTMPEIVLTPLIDTALTLLVIFIVTAPMVQNGIKIDLPQGKSKEVGSSQELVLTLGKDNKIYFNSYPVEKNQVVSVIQKELSGRPETPVYVRADENISYGKVIEVVDELKHAGVTYVAMSTRPFS